MPISWDHFWSHDSTLLINASMPVHFSKGNTKTVTTEIEMLTDLELDTVLNCKIKEKLVKVFINKLHSLF